MGSTRVTAIDSDQFELLRAELVEALSRMVHRVIESGKSEVSPALDQLALIRTTLANIDGIDDFLDDLDGAKRMLLLFLLA
jgi:hypothetical protein